MPDTTTIGIVKKLFDVNGGTPTDLTKIADKVNELNEKKANLSYVDEELKKKADASTVNTLNDKVASLGMSVVNGQLCVTYKE